MSNSKVPIPSSHYAVYKKLYHYLTTTLNLTHQATWHPPHWYMEIKKNYQQNHLKHNPVKTTTTLPSSSNNPNTLAAIEDIKHTVAQCMLCPLSRTRKNFVDFGFVSQNEKKENQNDKLPLMLIGDIPSFYDEIQKKYLSDYKIYDLLKKILSALNIDIEKCYLTTSIKCAHHTTELPHNLSAYHVCETYLKQEIKCYQPKMLLAFGEHTHRFLHKNDDFQNEKGKWLTYHEIPILYIYHPLELLRYQPLKKQLWNDLKLHRQKINELIGL